MYSDIIITPLQKEVEKLRIKVFKKKFSFTRKKDQRYLAQMEKLLLHYYKKYAILVEEEANFENKVKNDSNKNT